MGTRASYGLDDRHRSQEMLEGTFDQARPVVSTFVRNSISRALLRRCELRIRFVSALFSTLAGRARGNAAIYSVKRMMFSFSSSHEVVYSTRVFLALPCSARLRATACGNVWVPKCFVSFFYVLDSPLRIA